MCDPFPIIYLTLIPPALILLCAEYAAYRLPMDMHQAWKVGACIGMLISALLAFFILPSLLSSGLLCSGAAGA